MHACLPACLPPQRLAAAWCCRAAEFRNIRDQAAAAVEDPGAAAVAGVTVTGANPGASETAAAKMEASQKPQPKQPKQQQQQHHHQQDGDGAADGGGDGAGGATSAANANTTIDTALEVVRVADRTAASMLRPLSQRHWREQTKSAEFFLIVAFAVVHIYKSNSFLGINKQILAGYGDDDQLFLTIFTASLPASVLFAPVVSWLIDKHGIAATLHVVNGLGCLYALAALVPSLSFQLVTFVIYTNYRALLFSAMSVYNARCFGPASVGRLHGLAFTAAAVGCFGIYPTVSLTNAYLRGNFAAYSSLSAALCLPLAPAIWWVDVHRLKQSPGDGASSSGNQGDRSATALPSAAAREDKSPTCAP